MSLLRLCVFSALLAFANSACVDKVSTCYKAISMCNNQTRGATIRQNCPATCGTCVPDNPPCSDNPNCVGWVRNGFCTSSIYTKEMRERMCPKSCGSSACNKSQNQPKKNPPKNDPNEPKYKVFLESINPKADPCDDFYQFACGNYIKKHPANSATDNFATFNDLDDKVMSQQTKLIFDNEAHPSIAVKKMREFRDKCMNVAEIEKARTDKLRANLDTIGKCPMTDTDWNADSFDLTKSLIEMSKLSGNIFIFDIEATKTPDGDKVMAVFSPGDLIIKKINTYSDTDPAAATKVQALYDFMVNTVALIAIDDNSPKTFTFIDGAIDQVLKFEKDLAKIMTDNGYQDELKEQDKKFDNKKFNDMATIVPAVKWTDYIKDNPVIPQEVKTFFGTNPDIKVFSEKMLKEISAFYTKTDKATVANYLCLKYIINQIPYLDSRFSAIGNAFAEKIDGHIVKSGRSQDCFDCIKSNFPLVSDHIYITKYLPDKTVKTMDKMIEDLRKGLSFVFTGETWMSPTTKQNALNKLKKTKKIIGAVDDVKDMAKLDKRYEGIQFDPADSLSQMATKIKQYTGQQALMALINPKTATQSESMRATDVNAMAIYEENLIFMSAAILNSPFFDAKQPAAINYGSVGYIIGHELTHHFDSGGAEYDGSGDRKDWWDASTKQVFKDRSQCFIDLYGKQNIKPVNKNVDGKLTIEENIADNGGIRAAYYAYINHLNGKKERHVSGYGKYSNDQTFFISYGTSFCSSRSKEIAEMRLKTDTHSPPESRVNVVLSNFPEFAEAFKCKKGSRMNPTNQCAVW